MQPEEVVEVLHVSSLLDQLQGDTPNLIAALIHWKHEGFGDGQLVEAVAPEHLKARNKIQTEASVGTTEVPDDEPDEF